MYMLNDVRNRGVVQGANRLLAHTKRFFGWCVEQGIIDASPASDIRAAFKEQARDRVLSDTEIRRIWAALDQIGFPIGPTMQMLLLTGQRRDEVGHMCGGDLDLEAAIWTISAERNKSGRPHLVPLSSLALSILNDTPRSEGLVFWGRSPKTAINGWSKAKQKVDQLSGVTDWRIHDLRRTAAT